jgi:Inner membrane protein YgaP-like, transmembrane domain
VTIDRYVRLVAGLFVVASVVLGAYVNPHFYWFTAFVGLNLLQSAFTNWCPLISILKAAGVPR